jgi:transcriptional activator of cad operon
LSIATKYRVGKFVVVPQLNQLSCHNTSITLEPKAIDLLVYFIQNPARIASRAQIISAVWGPINVSDHAVNRLISQLRKALSDNQQPYQYIETVAKRGYRLIADVEILTTGDKPHKQRWIGAMFVAALLLVSAWSWLGDSTIKPFTPVGKAEVITSIPGREWLPRSTADGQWLSFLHQDSLTEQHQLYIKAKDNLEHHLLWRTDAVIRATVWLGKTHQLAITTFEHNQCKIEVFNFNASTINLSEVQQSIDCGNKPALKLAYSVFNQNLYWISGNSGLTGHTNTLRMRSLSGNHQVPGQSALPHLDNAYDITASVDGKSLLLLSHYQWERSSIYQYDIVNQSQSKLLDSKELIRSISWARKDSAFLFIENEQFRLMDLQGNESPVNRVKYDSSKDGYFSPDEERIYYTHTAATSKLYDSSPDANKQWSMTPVRWGGQDHERNPTFAHNGKTLAFISKRSGQYNIWVRDPQGALTALNTGDLDLSQTLVRWSENDRYLMFHSFNAVYRYDLANHSYQKISPDGIYADVVGWSYRDKSKVYVRSDSDGQFNIWLLDINDQSIKKLTHNGGFSGNESSDGQYLYYTKEQVDGLWRINLQTQTHQLFDKDFSRENYLSWYLFDNSIYYLFANGKHPGLFHWHLKNNTHEQLWQMPSAHFGGFAYSAIDNHSVWGLVEQGQWDIMSLKGSL